MNFRLGLMMTATALLQQVESPLGHVAFFDSGDTTDGPATGIAGQMQARRQAMTTSIGATFRVFERYEAARPDQDMRGLYDSLRRVAQGQTGTQTQQEMKNGNR